MNLQRASCKHSEKKKQMSFKLQYVMRLQQLKKKDVYISAQEDAEMSDFEEANQMCNYSRYISK